MPSVQISFNDTAPDNRVRSVCKQLAAEDKQSITALKAKIVREWQRMSPARTETLVNLLNRYVLRCHENREGTFIRKGLAHPKDVPLRDYWVATLRGDL